MNLKHLLISAAIPSSMIMLAGPAFAQTTIDTDQTTPVETSTAGDGGTADDVTITDGTTITLTGGTGVTINSDNTVTSGGNVIIEDADNATGYELQGGNTGELNLSGSIQLTEDYTPTDTDDDNVVDGPYAEGTGRTGILISGASPFAGNVTTQSASAITVEGNDSYGVRLVSTSGLNGDLNLQGVMNILGSNTRGVSLEGNVTGNVTHTGSIQTRGQNASGIVASGDITGQLNNSGIITNSGYRFSDRPSLAGRILLNDDDRLQAASAIEVNGNVTNGVFLQQVLTQATDENGDPAVDDNGDPVLTVTSVSNITQQGSAPAVLIDGQGTPIAIGIVASITDPNDEDYDAAEQYAFVNQGTLLATGVYDDINATAFEVRDASLTDGINNVGTIRASTFRSGNDGEADVAGETALARVIVLGSNAIAERINNSGLIIAQVSEATDEVYADRTNIIAARSLRAVAIDIAADASLSSLVNTGNISALLTGRDGDAIGILDSSGTLTLIENRGSIIALGATSDSLGEQDTRFNLIAMDLSANTSGITLNQIAQVDTDTTDDVTPVLPSIVGDIYLGSGDDTVDVSAGFVTGDLAFGGGADTLTLSGSSSYTGALSDTDGALSISVTDNSTLTNSVATPVDITDASFDATSGFRPTLDGATGLASTLNASGDISLADGATIQPILNNVISSTNSTFRILDAGGTLSVGGDLGSLISLDSPFMYNLAFAIDPNDANALIVTLDLRSTSELGLDAVQTSSFPSAFAAMQNNTDLANAFTNITDGGEFNLALSQLLPEFSAAARHFVVANVDGAVGAVGTHLENARKSQARPGGVWIEEFTYFADRDLAGLSEQYRGYGFGFTGGIDTAIGPFHTAGINFGFASTEIEDVVGVDEPLDVLTFQLGTYAGFETGNLGIEGYAGVGFNDFEATRNVQVGSFSDSAEGDWKGTHYNASLRAGYDINISKKFWARPVVSVDYLSLTEDAYTESGPTGVALSVDKRTSKLGGVTGMLNFGANFQGRRTWLKPSVRVGYRNEFINDGLVTNYSFAGLDNPATLTGEKFPSQGLLVGLSLAAGSDYSSFGFDIDSDIRDGFIRTTGRIVLRLIF